MLCFMTQIPFEEIKQQLTSMSISYSTLTLVDGTCPNEYLFLRNVSESLNITHVSYTNTH